MTAEITSYKSNPMICKYISFFKILVYYWQITPPLSLILIIFKIIMNTLGHWLYPGS